MDGGPRIARERTSPTYDAGASPALTVRPGDTVVFETADARSGALFGNPVGSLVELPRPPKAGGNPLTGPLAVEGARVGDALVVSIEDIACLSPGWVGAHAHVHPASPGRIPRPLVRICAVTDDGIEFSERVRLPVRPMVGCIGTAVPGEERPAGLPGRNGGNLDHAIVARGARVYLPVFVDGGLLYIGDVHAAQGDGELSSTGVEVAAAVTVSVAVERGLDLRWPWIETADRLAVATSAPTFEEARREAVDAALTALEGCLGLEPAEALGLVSAAADLRIGQAFGGMDLTVRLELPRLAGLRPT